MNRIKSLKIKNFKHIGNSYVGFDRIKNLNILKLLDTETLVSQILCMINHLKC